MADGRKATSFKTPDMTNILRFKDEDTLQYNFASRMGVKLGVSH